MPARKQSGPTIRDVAREAGVSIATVSTVLNNAPLARYISAATKLNITRTAKRMGYRPNLLARSLQSMRSQTVGLMVSDILDPYCVPILRGIESALFQSSYMPILTDFQNDRGRFERSLEMLLERRVEGIVLIANWLFVDVNLLADLESRNVATVIIGRQLNSDNTSSVIADNEAGAYAALEHLYSLGHRKVAIIGGPPALGDTAERWRGIRSFARAHKLALDPKLIGELPESALPFSGFEASQRIVEDWLKRRRQFTAILAFDDLTALGAVRALKRAGVSVPRECSVIGFDDVMPAAVVTPKLTTIRQPMENMGSTAVHLLLDALTALAEKRVTQAEHRVLSTELVVRESTAAPPEVAGI